MDILCLSVGVQPEQGGIMANKIYKAIASALTAIENCKNSNNKEWEEKHGEALERLMQSAPSGSGFDSGTQIVSGNAEKIVFKTAFHHMNENGMYCGWSEHTITVSPSLLFDFTIKISGRNVNDIKDYIGDVFHTWLDTEVKI